MPRHDLDAVSLVAGIAFSGLAVVMLVDHGLGFPARWGLPLVLILVGLAGLVVTATRR